MPSIAEILERKRAEKAAAAAPAPAPAGPKKSLAQRAAEAEDRAETQEALDRVDPPGKRKAALGIVVTKQEASPEPSPPDAPSVTADPGPRSLGQSEGEAIDVTPLHADQCIKDWHRAVTAFSTDLVIMRDPVDPERAWLAVRLEEEPNHPLLLKDLPIYDHPRMVRTGNEPF